MPYVLNTRKLREVAEAKGDKTDYAIAKRTGISQSSVHRLCHGKVEPSIRHLDALHRTYEAPVCELYLFIPDQAAAA